MLAEKLASSVLAEKVFEDETSTTSETRKPFKITPEEAQVVKLGREIKDLLTKYGAPYIEVRITEDYVKILNMDFYWPHEASIPESN